MKIEDLLELLAAEYASGVEDARRPLNAVIEGAVEQPDVHVSFDETMEFLSRSVAACDMVSLVGLSAFLQHLGQVVLTIDGDASLLRAAQANWANDALDVASALLSAPSSPEMIELVNTHAAQSPLSPSQQWLDELSAALLTPPTLSDDGDVDGALRLEPVSEADVSLATTEADPELLSSMLHDAPRQLERLYIDLSAYAATKSPAPGSLAESQRIAHTLKGSGNIIGIPGVARLAHRLEDVLVWLDTD
ncbi:MAG: Hpt domain-containing protein, partial [Casimicrobium sp.]